MLRPRRTLSYTPVMLDAPSNRPALPAEITRRRTFAIISHPDAGKTTLTEKFLLYGGAIQMAGQVRAKGEENSRLIILIITKIVYCTNYSRNI